jgi:hypothetical protein
MEKRNMINSSKETIQKNKEICKKIQSLSPRIRYVGMINDFGRTIAGHLRKGVVPLFDTDQAINDHFIEATRIKLRKALSPAVGNPIYTLTKHEKVIMLTVPTSWGIYNITLDRETEFMEIKDLIDKIQKLITTLE